MPLDELDFSSLKPIEIEKVRLAIKGNEELIGHIGSDKTLRFVLNNYRQLAELKVLEKNWMTAYLHVHNFNGVSLSQLQSVFDACDRDVLQTHFPIYVGDHFSNGVRFSLFRGCAGPQHQKGMSWTSSLDKAIWYATDHTEKSGLNRKDMAVYATTVDRSEIYCCGDHYEFDYIVHPQTWWKVDVPESEFTRGRQR